MHAFQLYSTLNKVTSRCINVNESQLIEFLFHGTTMYIRSVWERGSTRVFKKFEKRLFC